MHTISSIVTAVQEDFDFRSIEAETVFGSWNVAQHAGANRVIIGLGDGDLSFQDLNPQWASSPQALPTTTQSASAIAFQLQKMKVWVHGVCPSSTAEID